MAEPISVRQGTLSDAEAIAQFNIDMALETEDKVLDPQVILEGVRSLMKSPHYGFYLVAESSNRIAGSLMVTSEWSDWRNALFWWIQSVFIPQEFRRQGIFRTLYQHTEKLANADGNVCGIRLYVEEENTKAQNTYSNVGMTKSHYQMFEKEF